jgi:hypothetical protein
VPAHEIETVVVTELRALLDDPAALLDLLASVAPDLAEQQALLHAAASLGERWSTLAPAQVRALVRAVVARVVLREQQIDIQLIPSRLRDLLHRGAIDALSAAIGSAATGERGRHVTLSVDVRLKRCRGETKLVVPARAPLASPSRPNPALIKALVRAHQWFDQLRSGQASSIRHVALTNSLTERYVARILQLVFLAPDIQEALLHGTQPPDLTIDHLRQPLPLSWAEQRQRLGLPQVPSERCGNGAPQRRAAINQRLLPP